MPDDVEMSPATRAILHKVARMIPPLKPSFHKGQLGRVGVIGGSEDYTGAPYFSAMASAKLGCDMSHVICTPAAAAVIKTYSPNLMVHPLMRQSSDSDSATFNLERETDRAAKRVEEMLGRLHVLVVGPGLGRDTLMQAIAARTLTAARGRGMPAVIDADALQIVASQPEIVRGWREAILTPNVVEFERLCRALNVEAKVDVLARALGGVTVVQKGREDLISDGGGVLVGDGEGGRKRSGGQGDTLTGAVATFLGWRRGYLEGLWEEEPEEGPRLGGEEMMGLAAFGGSAITRECSRLAFLKKGRSLQASDLTEEVHNAFLRLFGDDIQD